jgi:topoisomerase-4 subunit A
MKDGKLQDIQCFAAATGFTWNNGKDKKIQANIEPWLGKRAGSGKLPPFGFLKSNNFEN